MRKTSMTFLKVGAILGFIFGVIFFICGIILAIVGKMKVDADYLKAFQEIIQKFFDGNVNKFRDAVFAYGVWMIIMAICSVASSVLCIISRNKPKMGNFIAVIVLCALGGSVFGLLGGIFGLVANGQEQRAAQPAPAPQPVEEPKEEPKEEQPKEEE